MTIKPQKMETPTWLEPKTAPRDGTWVILQYEYDESGIGPCVGRWNPKYFDDLEVTYEWEVVEEAPVDPFNFWPDDRMTGWMPLPALPT